VCFRHVPDGVADLDAHNDRLGRAMQTDGRVYVAPAAIDGRTCLRACFVNFRTRSDEVPLVIEVARALGDALAGVPE
jgi:aromatic-L-amino-acid decarboxylase